MIDCMAGVFDRIQAHSLDRAFHLLTTRTATADGDVAAGMAREGTHRARPGSFFFLDWTHLHEFHWRWWGWWLGSDSGDIYRSGLTLHQKMSSPKNPPKG